MSTDQSTHPTPNEDYIRIIPLGGLDEVGMNCCLIECNGSMLMIDCGLTFPDTEGFGIDVILPDWSYAMSQLDKLDAVILTHAHEDHIGALPFFLHEVDVPVYSGHFTLALLHRKLVEHQLDDDVELCPVEPGDILDMSPFEIEFVHINHSIPNAMSIVLNTPLGRLLFTGDWKLDQTPGNEPVMDLQRLAQLGQEGILALLGDSTNAITPGFSRSEHDVMRGISEHIKNAKGRVFVVQFSSNLYRVNNLMHIAHEYNRRVVLLGRSLNSNFDVACDQGFISPPASGLIVDLDDINDIPDDELLVISTGSQGEPRSSMARLAYDDHNRTSIRPTDTVILSARRIPGNERRILNMLNQLTKRQVTVITPADHPEVHATGHARQEELKLLINLTQPTHLIPMHGAYHMRQKHAQLGARLGVPNRHMLEDGHILQMTRDETKIIDRVQYGRVFVDGRVSGGDIENVQLRDRKKLAQSGIIVAFAILDRANGELTEAPSLFQRGFLNEPGLEMLDGAAEYALHAVNQLRAEVRQNPAEVSEAIRTAVRRFFRKRIDRKPVVIPIVHDM